MNELLSKLQRCGIVWIAAVMLTQMTAAAQSVLLTGKVVDTDGAPVIGAGIISMQKKTTGTTSDLDGKFSFKVPDGTESVLFSSVGMKDVVYKIVPGKTDGITVVMEWESTQLDQVVVTGYAQTTVKRITGSVAVINSDKFEAKAISSVDALMQGEVRWCGRLSDFRTARNAVKDPDQRREQPLWNQPATLGCGRSPDAK